MANWVHRTTKVYLSSTSESSLSEAVANYIENPDVSAVTGFSSTYWIITGDVITLMDQATRDAVDAAALVVAKDGIADELDAVQTILRAFTEVLLDELNARADTTNAILDAIDSGNSLGQIKSSVAAITDYPQRTLAQLKTAVRSKL